MDASDDQSASGARARLIAPIAATLACVLLMLVLVPAGIEAGSLIAIRDDPAAVADHMLDHSLDAAAVRREIEEALAAGDADLARSFLELARERRVPVGDDLTKRVEAANSATASAARTAGSFARGFVTGEPSDLAGLAGTAVGDLFVFGDIRDAVREGGHLATGQPADELILGLACTGLVITAGTYATAGVGMPARVGLSVVKAARAGGRMSARVAAWIGRSLREVVDFGALARAFEGATVTAPLIAVRAARDAFKAEKTEELLQFAGDVGSVQGKAGTQAALDGLKIAEGPRDMSRIAKVAEKYGGKTRAVLKLGGRAAIWLTLGMFQLTGFVVAAILNLAAFCAACKRVAERMTERYCRRRRLKMQAKNKPRLRRRIGRACLAPAAHCKQQ